MFQALELALATDPPRFDKAKDWPEHKAGSTCTIVLSFDMGQDVLANGDLVNGDLGDLIGRERVFALLDADEAGKSAKAILVEKLKTARFQGGQVLLYSEVVAEDGVPVEAEDLFPEALVQAFLKVNPQFMAECQRGKNRAHVGLTKEGKAPFCAWLESHVKLQQLGRWNDLIEKLVARAAVAVEKRKAAAAEEMPGGAVLPASSGSGRREPSRRADGTTEAPQHGSSDH